MSEFRSVHVAPAEVHERLAEHLLVDGYRLVLDAERSHGSWLVDARDGTEYLDLYTQFASAPLGANPPGIVDDQGFMALLATVAVSKPANPDMYTTHLAEFVETFARVLGDPALPHLFFVEGGALAVENAVKTAFDWKSRRNEAAGRSRDLGTQVMHLTRAFHGRSGYTMSLTNTDPAKTDRYPAFDWPRIDVPAVTFPLEAHRADVDAAEARALDQARAAFEANPHDIACFIAEPIQAEGGDNHMRPEFLQAMQEMCHAYDALFVLDEVQTGVGITGTAWAYQQLVIEPDGLFDHAAKTGSYLLNELQGLGDRHSGIVSNARGRGLMCAIDLPDPSLRDRAIGMLRETHVLVLPCGERTIRFRPALNIT